MAPPFFQKSSTGTPFSGGSSTANFGNVTKADIARDLDIARGRKEFFGNNPNVSDDRALRRMKQADELQRFKNLYTRPAGGSKTNLLQMTADAPRSLAQERMRLANLYGPTPKEIFGDMTRAAGSMIGGFAEKGGPIMNAAKGLFGGIQNFFSPLNPMPALNTGMQALNTGVQKLQSGFNDFMQSGQNFNTLLMGLPPYQRRVYDMEIMKPGMTREQAFRSAIRTQKMATDSPFSTSASNTVPMSNANMMQTSQSLNNLTEFGQSLANRIKTDRPNISDADLLEALQRSDRAGFASQGRPVFTTGMFAQGGVASL
jgi:X-X-X-Leu-X-X-Gly heptad repeat protein